MAIIAPTGVAAINAGGVTIHSFFQLPLSPFIPSVPDGGLLNAGEQINTPHTLLKGLRYTNEKKRLIRQLELLIIDEISMVRCDLLDTIDVVLRHTRFRHKEPFGGVQVLFIGDMFQLPPVIKGPEQMLLSQYYEGPYFFNSYVLRDHPPINIEFNKIYRQSEEKFIRLLNQVRDNAVDEEGKKLLESKYQPDFHPESQEGYIILTTHNNKAIQINNYELDKLESPLSSYEAVVTDDFPDRAYPGEVKLQLKLGAQVMFIRNDSSDRGKRYYNGKIGFISRLEKDKIFVTGKNAEGIEEQEEIEVQREKWENIRYSLNKSSGNLDSELLGSFTQFPLRLAWAITIHKSQGLTFQKAIIDAGEAFAAGQVYVALSRCTSLSGVVLKSRITNSTVLNDPAIIEFSKRSHSRSLLENELVQSKWIYSKTILISTFDFNSVFNIAKELVSLLDEQRSSFNNETALAFDPVYDKIEQLRKTSAQFQVEITKLFEKFQEVKSFVSIQPRINAGAAYFIREISDTSRKLDDLSIDTDSWPVARDVNELVRDLFEQLSRKKYLLEGFAGQFDIDNYHKRRLEFKIPGFRFSAHSTTRSLNTITNHPILLRKLKSLRDQLCAKKQLPVYLVASSKTLEEMVRYLPHTLEQLHMISGFGDAKVEQYGQQFLDLIIDYSTERDLISLIEEKIPKRQRGKKSAKDFKINSSGHESLRMFKEGMSVDQIAADRKLTLQTIETHLMVFIKTGELHIDQLLDIKRYNAIQEALKNYDQTTITQVKNRLGEEYTFNEIRWVVAWNYYQKNLEEAN